DRAARPRVFRPAFPQLDLHRRHPQSGDANEQSLVQMGLLMEYRLAGTRLLKREQLLFGLQAPSIARQLAIRADRAMTRDQDRHRIRSIGMADGARRRGPPDARCDLTVAARGAFRNLAQLAPYAELK